MKFLVRFAISVAVLAVFAMIVIEVFQRYPELRTHRKLIAGALASGGTLLWLISKAHDKGEDQTHDRVLSLRFCGSILAATAAIVTNITPLQQLMAAPTKIFQVPRLSKASVTDLPVRASEKGEPAVAPSRGKRSKGGNLPNFRLQGIIYNPRSPSAIVNGKTVFVGDRVDHARIAAIERDSVTLQIAEEKRVLAVR